MTSIIPRISEIKEDSFNPMVIYMKDIINLYKRTKNIQKKFTFGKHNNTEVKPAYWHGKD